MLLVLTTLADMRSAKTLARCLIDQRLAACASAIPGLVSIYRWEGNIVEEEEVQLLIKTTAERLDDLRQAFAERHPYELPEFIVLRPDDASGDYERWVHRSTGGNR